MHNVITASTAITGKINVMPPVFFTPHSTKKSNMCRTSHVRIGNLQYILLSIDTVFLFFILSAIFPS